jgi:E3 ubiquitin-protein ligase FANCL
MSSTLSALQIELLKSSQLFYNEFPYLLPENVDCSSYHGFLTFPQYNKQYRIKLSHNQQPSNQNGAILVANQENKFILEVDKDYQQLLLTGHSLLMARCSPADSLYLFCRELVDITNRLLHNQLQNQMKSPEYIAENVAAEYYCSLIQELETIGLRHLDSLSKDLTSIQLSAIDSQHRKHILSLKLSTNYPAALPTISTQLPTQFNAHSVALAYARFLEEIANYQLFFNELENLHANCWVLEPDRVNYAVSILRIALEKGVSLLIHLNPKFPRDSPLVMRLQGNESRIQPFNRLIQLNLKQWNSNNSVRDNLQSLLQLQLPANTGAKNSKAAQTQDDLSQECAICYSYKLNNSYPTAECLNSKCSKLFHSQCLIEWGKSLPTARSHFGILYTICPACLTEVQIEINKQ